MDDVADTQTQAAEAPYVDDAAISAAVSVEAILAATNVPPTTNLVRSAAPEPARAVARSASEDHASDKT
jgi:hypothetical protein